MSTIVYTITLQNADGTQAVASTLELEYPETPSAHLQAMAQKNVADLQNSHVALMEMMKNVRPDEFELDEEQPDIPAVYHRPKHGKISAARAAAGK